MNCRKYNKTRQIADKPLPYPAKPIPGGMPWGWIAGLVCSIIISIGIPTIGSAEKILGSAGYQDSRTDRTIRSAARSDRSSATLSRILKTAVDRPRVAFAMARKVREPYVRLLSTWIVARSGGARLTSSDLSLALSALTDWPGLSAIRAHLESALARENASANAFDKRLKGKPESTGGRLAYARALVAAGRRNSAAEIVRSTWTTRALTRKEERSLRLGFGTLLRKRDHRARIEYLLSKDRVKGAARVAARLGAADTKYVRARAAAIRRHRGARRNLVALPSWQKKNGFRYGLVKYLRKSERLSEALRVLQVAGTDQNLAVDGSRWWVERKLLSQDFLKRGRPADAYQAVRNLESPRPIHIVESNFIAGWIALRKLGDARRAEVHFRKIIKTASKPLSLTRGYYWLARSLDRQGKTRDARNHFGAAAKYGTTYYGQLARIRLGRRSIVLPESPKSDASRRQAFNRKDMVRAVRLLVALDHDKDGKILIAHLSKQLNSGHQLAMLAQLAASAGFHKESVQVGMNAVIRGFPLYLYAFPANFLPKYRKLSRSAPVEYVLAVTKQESRFDPKARSPANALGLMQLLGSTARRVARAHRVRYSRGKLTSDPGYNAMLGSALLGSLLQEFNGSIVLALCAYNAGPRRAREWKQRFGDPSNPKVDAIDWIEQIPFSETRNYVQRVIENVQVFRFLSKNRRAGKLWTDRDIRLGGLYRQMSLLDQ